MFELSILAQLQSQPLETLQAIMAGALKVSAELMDSFAQGLFNATEPITSISLGPAPGLRSYMGPVLGSVGFVAAFVDFIYRAMSEEAGGSFGSARWFFVEWLAVLGAMSVSVIAYGNLYGPSLNGSPGLFSSNAACGGGYAYQYNVANYTGYAVAELSVVGAFAGGISLPSGAPFPEKLLAGAGLLIAGGSIYFSYSDLVAIHQQC
jgi:hypothetical protein